jgi:DNA-binding response OmpR family regulator
MTEHRARVLVIEDEPEMIDLLQLMLSSEGFETITARDALAGIRAAYHTHPDAILLDVMMPRMDGFEACRRLRKITSAPILIVTGVANSAQDVARGLSLGADDYVAKPFRLPELLSRLNACLRRAGHRPAARTTYLSPTASVILDCDRHELILENRRIYLSPREFQVLELLIRHAGKTLGQDAILAQVWGPERVGEPNLVKQYIHQLRKKIDPHLGVPRYIHSDWGEGYYFLAPSEPEAAR